MHSVHLNEHDANQGAQSAGEFLGMTGNCGWYLLGAAGTTILMVIFLWGIFGVSLLLCLLVGSVLCGLSVAYVFALKNNRPEHYDTDFFESALVEAGVLPFRFGPRERPPANPFVQATSVVSHAGRVCKQSSPRPLRPSTRQEETVRQGMAARDSASDEMTKRKGAGPREEAVVARTDYEQLQEQLVTAEEMLDEALAERGEN